MTAPRPSWALALSGGGHRAALFALGALMYVVDAGRNRDTTSIASVSGGSLANGFLAQTLDFQAADPAGFEREVVAPFAGQLARRGTLFAPWFTRVYLAALVAGLFAAFLPLWLGPDPRWLRVLMMAACLLAWAWLLWQRGRVCAAAFRATLFSPGGRVTRLEDLKAAVCHVICATELRTAESFYYSGKFVYGFEFGSGRTGGLPLHQAVQASAAFPGGFPPTCLPARRHAFAGCGVPGEAAPRVRTLVLSDGGTYDNMADQWARGYPRRLDVWPDLATHCPAPTGLVVVNASPRRPWVPMRLRWLPVWNEIAAFLRVVDVLYVNTTNVRRQDIVASHSPLAPAGAGLPGILVQIAQSPYDVPDGFAKAPDPVVRGRAEAAIRSLDATGSRDAWREIARGDLSERTSLCAMGRAVTARLLRHGYVTAMCNLHVLFGDGPGGWPLLPVPSSERFERLVG